MKAIFPSRTLIGALLALTSGAVVAGQQPPDPQQILAAAREAMGGSAALDAVKQFSIVGRHVANMGDRQIDSSLEVSCAFPDKYVRQRTSSNYTPIGSFDIIQRDGFVGDQPIRETLTPGSPLGPPPEIPGSQPRTPQQAAERIRLQVLRQHQVLTQLTLALFATSLEGYPLEFKSAGRALLDGGVTADIVDATGAGGFVFRLFVDVTSHLPVMVSWKEPPMVIASTSSVMTMSTVESGGVVSVPRGARQPAAPPPLLPPASAPLPPVASAPPGGVAYNGIPSGDPTAGLPLVEHRLWLSDYRAVGAIKWPHRLIDRIEGQIAEDTKIGKIKVNPKFGASVFKSAK